MKPLIRMGVGTSTLEPELPLAKEVLLNIMQRSRQLIFNAYGRSEIR